jgi:hypothetical protein
MDTTGDMGTIKQMWLNEGGVAAIVPLKVLEKIWTFIYIQTSQWIVCLAHRPRRYLHQEQQQEIAIPGHPNAKNQSLALVNSNSAGQYGGIHEAQGQRGSGHARGPSHARSPNRPRVSRNGTFQHD